MLSLLAAALAARKCSDGLCIPIKAAEGKTAVIGHKTVPGAVSEVISSTVTNTNDFYGVNTSKREEVPLISKTDQNFAQSEEYYKDTLDFGYRGQANVPLFTQINETTEMFEQTLGGGGGVTTTVLPTRVETVQTTYGGGTVQQQSQHHSSSQQHSSAHHSSHRNLAMDSLFYSQAEYELSNVTMTPNGKYALIGQSNGPPQIWDTLSGQLIRTMGGSCFNCNNLTLACNGTLLIGLGSEGNLDLYTQSLHIWEVQSGKPIILSHQIKCCVFSLSADTNSIFMAGNQRFGNGISVGILDLVTNELTKEIKSDPSISFGECPESITVTPDERHAIVGCRSISGTNFVVFDITKSTEIAQTKSIALDAMPKCIVAPSNSEVVTGTRGGHLVQWNIHSCTPTISFDDPADMQAHRASINQLLLSCDNEFLVSVSSDGTAKVWNARNKSLVSVLTGHRAEVNLN